MKAADKKVVSIEYTLKDDSGEVLDSSEGGSPLVYMHGAGNIVVGLERALEGKGVGDSVQVVVAPEDGYGTRDENLVVNMPIRKFPGGKVEVGQVFHAQTDGGHMPVQVISVSGDYAKVDGNHPLADTTLHFDVKIVDIRDATEEELAHGHVHGPDGHHHH